MRPKIKNIQTLFVVLQILLLVLFLCLVGLFLFSTLSKQGVPLVKNDRKKVLIDITDRSPKTYMRPVENFVASHNGTKFYPLGCAGANRIKEENRVYFTSSAEAIAAGYEAASGCQ